LTCLAGGSDTQDDVYKYVPVRRLALFLEESLYRGTRWAIFEPNDERLWTQIRANLAAFMHNLYAQGAFTGKDAPGRLLCQVRHGDHEPERHRRRRLNIVVGFAPLKSAEFVVIKIQQIAASSA